MRIWANKRALLGVLALLLVGSGCVGTKEATPIFHQDLHPFGFVTDKDDRIISSFTDINFLSDNLVLVSVSNRVYGPVEPLNADKPISKLLLFDVAQRSLINTTEMPIEKAPGSVRSTTGGQFVLLNEAGLHLCSPELKCKFVLATSGPIVVSPAETRVVVGGNGQTEQKLLDGVSLEEIERFSWKTPVVPGDDGLLVRRENRLYTRLPHLPDQPLKFGGLGIFPEARFLNRNTIADFESDKELAIAKTDGTILFRVPVTARWHITDIVTSTAGSRFCFHEAGYTKFNSIVNFYDIDEGRPLNFETVKVMTTDVGKPLLTLLWDPRPSVGYLPIPALSPDGHKIAVVRNGFLDVFYIQ